MIIFRVTTGRSFAKFPIARDGSLSNPLQFAPQTAESTFLQSTLNRESGRNLGADTERENGADGTTWVEGEVETEKRDGKVEYIEKAY